MKAKVGARMPINSATFGAYAARCASKNWCMAVLALGLLATPAHAQSLKLPLAVYAGAAGTDLHSTYRFLQYGHREANPLGRWLDHNPPALIAFSVAADAAAVYTVYKVWGRHHRKAARIVLYSVAAVRVGLAVYNYRGLSNP